MNIFKKDPTLYEVYYQEMGKKHAKSVAKDLRKVEIEQGWFVIMVDIIIAGDTTQKGVKAAIQRLLTKENGVFLTFFRSRKVNRVNVLPKNCTERTQKITKFPTKCTRPT